MFFDNGGSREWDYLYRILYHGVFFVGGILFFHNKEWLAMASKKGLLLFLIALPACVLYQDNMQKLPMVKELVAWLMILALISLARVVTDYTRRIKVIEYYGKNSLYIYVIHNYLTVIFRTVYNKFNVAVSPLIYITCNTVVAILICVMVCELAKRFTLINLFFQPIKETKHLRDKLFKSKNKE